MRLLDIQENIKKYNRIDECPIRNVVAQFSGKWQMLVLCVLAENTSTRFSAIEKALPDISPKVLSRTLRELERHGLVSRKVYAEIPPRVEYSLTGLGRSLMPLLENLISWAYENFEKISGCGK